MGKFEVGKRYVESGITYEIIKRTAKTVRFVEIQHPGRFNERIADVKTAKIRNWDSGEVIIVGHRTIVA